jgi:outer membrane protein TolC
MRSPLKYLFIFCFTYCIFQDATAQVTAATDTATNKKNSVMPPLEVLIDSAIKHNAMLKYRNLEVEIKESNLVTQRNAWLRTFGLQGDSRYGTIDAFSTNANGVTSTSNSTQSKQLNYAIGVYIKIPVFEVLNRKTQIKQAKAEIQEAQTMAEAQHDEIRQLVIRQYQEFLLRQKLMNIRSLNLGSATVNMDMVEKQFRNGVIPVTEYVRLSDMTSRIQSDYELAKSEFLLAKKILEEITGFTFSNPDLK